MSVHIFVHYITLKRSGNWFNIHSYSLRANIDAHRIKKKISAAWKSMKCDALIGRKR